jgi:hypothetical protein
MTILDFLEQPEVTINYFAQKTKKHAIVFKVKGVLNCNPFSVSFEPANIMDAFKRITRLL